MGNRKIIDYSSAQKTEVINPHPCKCCNTKFANQYYDCTTSCEKLARYQAQQICQCVPQKEYSIPVSYDGLVCVSARSAKEAEAIVRRMPVDEMYKQSDGTWDIDEAIEINE